MELGFENQKTNVGIRISILEILCVPILLTFLVQIYLKIDLGFETQKTNVGIRISILEIPYVPIFRQNWQLWLFQPKFA